MKCNLLFYLGLFVLCLLHTSSSNLKSLIVNNKFCRVICNSLLPFTIMSTLTFQSNIADTNEDYRITINRNYLFKAKFALDQLAQDITSETKTSELYDDIDKITTKAQMTERINFLAEYFNQNNIDSTCHKTTGSKVIEDKNIIFEYFSISNDGKKKLMISDAYPGQKLKFIRQGLSALRSDLNQFLFCPY